MTSDNAIRAALLGYVNDTTGVERYRAGHLITLPLRYSDGDRVEVYIEPFSSSSFRVTDRGVSELRLEMAGVNLENRKVSDAIARSLPSDLFDLGERNGEISGVVDEQDLAEVLLRIGEASIRIDQLRYLAPPPRRRPFAESVINSLRAIVASNVDVHTDYQLKTRGGRTRRVTAAVQIHDRYPLIMQAVSGSEGRLEDDSVEHCFYLFGSANQHVDGKVAVLPGSRDSTDLALVRDLETVSSTVAFIEDESLRDTVNRYTHATL